MAADLAAAWKQGNLPNIYAGVFISETIANVPFAAPDDHVTACLGRRMTSSCGGRVKGHPRRTRWPMYEVQPHEKVVDYLENGPQQI